MSDQKNPSSGMVTALQTYINRMISVPGMKAMLMDQDTTKMVGLVYSMTDIIAHEVFDMDLLKPSDGKNDDEELQHHLKAVVFVRPTPNSFQLVCNMLRKPKYREYHIFFSNILTEQQLKLLAQADEQCLVREVQEFYADFYALESNLFSLEMPVTRSLVDESKGGPLMDRSVQGILACLLAHKRRPQIRYPAGSSLCRTLAHEVQQAISADRELFYFQQRSQPLLLLLDRRDDPLTPLLSQWTYQAMVHELIGISNNRIDLGSVPGISPELREVVLAPHQDDFFREAMYLNFGDLGKKLKELVSKFQREKKTQSNVNSIEDMQRFVDAYPEFKRAAGNVSKHVQLTSEIARLVDVRRLMNVSEVEQEMACQDQHSEHLQMALEVMEDIKVRFFEKLRLVLIYALRYETHRTQIEQFVKILQDRAANSEERALIATVNHLINYAGQARRGGDLFESKSFLAKASRLINTGLQGVDNVYTQHKPVLSKILDQVLKSKLKPAEFPFLDTNGNPKTRPAEVFVFVLGGITYQEAAVVEALNATNSGTHIVLGGNCVHNSQSFVKSLLGADGNHTNRNNETTITINI
jgi:vacuolar protein sorting-associated protein 45